MDGPFESDVWPGELFYEVTRLGRPPREIIKRDPLGVWNRESCVHITIGQCTTAKPRASVGSRSRRFVHPDASVCHRFCGWPARIMAAAGISPAVTLPMPMSVANSLFASIRCLIAEVPTRFGETQLRRFRARRHTSYRLTNEPIYHENQTRLGPDSTYGLLGTVRRCGGAGLATRHLARNARMLPECIQRLPDR